MKALFTEGKATNVDLSNCKVSDAEAVKLAEFLKTNTTLLKLDLNYNQITSVGCTAFVEALKINKTLTELNVSWNHMGETVKAFEQVTAVNKTVKILSHSNKSFILQEDKKTPEQKKADEEKKAEEDRKKAEEEKKKAEVKVRIDPDHPQHKRRKQIFNSLKEGKLEAEEIDLSNSKVSDEDAIVLAGLLRANPTIRKLKLDYNQIGPKGCEALCNALKDNKVLTSLDLSWNRIGVAAVNLILDLLTENKTIIELPLQSNQFEALPQRMNPIYEKLKFNKDNAPAPAPKTTGQ